MARVHFVKAARKDNPAVKKGEPYYWWAFRFGGKHYSKTTPKPSQLTQSEFLSSVLAALESLEDLSADEEADDLKAAVEQAASEIRDAGENAQSSYDNMPEGLQQGDTGQLLESRAQAAEELADNLEGVELEEVEREDGESDADFEERQREAKEEYINEVTSFSYDGD